MTLRLSSLQPSTAYGRGGKREEHCWNPDHAPRIRAQQQAEIENAEMELLEQRSAPLLWAVFMAVMVLSLGQAVHGVHDHLQRDAEEARNSKALVQCLNGKPLRLGSALVRCEVREFKLVTALGDQQ